MTPDGEGTLDEAAARIHDRMGAFAFYADAFFRSEARWLGWDDGEAALSLNFDLVFTARRREPKLAWSTTVERDTFRYLTQQTEQKLYPGAGSFRDGAVERAYLLRPQWEIEKAAARALVARLSELLPPHARAASSRG